MGKGKGVYPRKRWMPEEIKYLEEHYSTEPLELLQENLPNRTWDAIKIQAERLNLSRKALSSRDRRHIDISNLLLETNEAYYWAGFLMADGSFDTTVMRMKCALSQKDISHLKLLALFLGAPETAISLGNDANNYAYCALSVQDKELLPLFVKKFDLKANKTENPPTELLIPDNNDKESFSEQGMRV